VDESMNQS
jgi:hypothetical protein